MPTTTNPASVMVYPKSRDMVRGLRLLAMIETHYIKRMAPWTYKKPAAGFAHLPALTASKAQMFIRILFGAVARAAKELKVGNGKELVNGILMPRICAIIQAVMKNLPKYVDLSAWKYPAQPSKVLRTPRKIWHYKAAFERVGLWNEVAARISRLMGESEIMNRLTAVLGDKARDLADKVSRELASLIDKYREELESKRVAVPEKLAMKGLA